MERVLGSGNVKPNSQVTVTVSAEVGTLHLGCGENDAVTSASSSVPRQAGSARLPQPATCPGFPVARAFGTIRAA